MTLDSSSVRSTPSDGEDDEVNMKYDRSPGDEKVMEWAKVCYFTCTIVVFFSLFCIGIYINCGIYIRRTTMNLYK